MLRMFNGLSFTIGISAACHGGKTRFKPQPQKRVMPMFKGSVHVESFGSVATSGRVMVATKLSLNGAESHHRGETSL